MNNNFSKVLITFICLFFISSSTIAVEKIQLQPQNDTLGLKETVSGPLATKEIEVITVEDNNPGEEIDIQLPPPEQTEITKAVNKFNLKPSRGKLNLLLKFFLGIIWVGISSVIIFVILLSYKKLVLKNKPVVPTYESTENSLDTPKNFKEAIKLFLDKTKWN